MESDDVRNRIKRIAEERHAQYPQYRGHWDSFKLVRVRRRIRTKLDLAFEAGELTIARVRDLDGEPYISAYSLRNNCDTMIGMNDASFL